jgi:hypothetical protein
MARLRSAMASVLAPVTDEQILDRLHHRRFR